MLDSQSLDSLRNLRYLIQIRLVLIRMSPDLPEARRLWVEECHDLEREARVIASRDRKT